MARLTDTLAGRFALIVLVVHVVLLPGLYWQLDRIVTRSHVEMFLTEIRTYARVVADELELGTVLDSEEHARTLLENILLGGEGVFAEIVEGGNVLRVRVTAPAAFGHFLQEDFEFGHGDDQIYYLATPITRNGRDISLRIGFDERPVLAQIARARQRILASLTGYFILALTAAVYMGRRLARPLVELKRASRRVAEGDMESRLTTDSRIFELRGLASNLETMRASLVEVGRRLEVEMHEREQAVSQREQLEQQLQLRHRLETVGTLAGGIAHEFNNVLVPIQLYTEMAIEDLDEDSPIRADLVRVLDGARRAKRIVSDILVFTRRPHGQRPESVDAGRVVRDVIDLYRKVAPPGVSIEADIPGEAIAVAGDAAMLHHVVTNLCSNAMQAMGEAGALTVTLAPASAGEVSGAALGPGEYVVLRVRDTGHGMDAATRQRIFEPFFTTRAAGRGTGLGLSVVHGMVENMGGAVTVDSAPAAGAVFSVFLKIAGPVAAPAE